MISLRHGPASKPQTEMLWELNLLEARNLHNLASEHFERIGLKAGLEQPMKKSSHRERFERVTLEFLTVREGPRSRQGRRELLVDGKPRYSHRFCV